MKFTLSQAEKRNKLKARQLGISIEQQYGKAQLVLTRVLLANPVFRTMVEIQGGSLTLETYLKKFYGMIVQYGVVFTFCYYLEGDVEKHHFSAQDDIFASLAYYAMNNVKDNLKKRGLISDLANKLKLFGRYRAMDRSPDDKIDLMKATFKRERFEKEVLPQIKEQNPVLAAEYEEAAENDYLFFDTLTRVFDWLRINDRNIQWECTYMGRQVSMVEAMQALSNISEDPYISTRVEQSLVPALEALCKARGLRSIYEDGMFRVGTEIDPFSLAGGKRIDVSWIECAKFKKQSLGSLRTDIAAESSTSPSDLVAEPETEAGKKVKEFIHKDLNDVDTVRAIKTEVVKSLIKQMSNTFAGKWNKGFLMTATSVDDAVIEAKERLKKGLKNVSEEDLEALAVYKIVSMKGALTVTGKYVKRALEE